MKPPAPIRLPWLLALSALVFLLDRIAKALVVAHIPLGAAIPVAPYVLHISHCANYGGNFGLFAGAAQESQLVHWGLAGVNAFIPLVLLVVMVRLSDFFPRTSIGLALAVGGTLGNLCDRIAYGSVVDFIEVQILSYHWPAFNLADIGYVTGFSLLLLDLLLRRSGSKQRSALDSEKSQPNPQEGAL
jgi:signal peptidase II